MTRVTAVRTLSALGLAGALALSGCTAEPAPAPSTPPPAAAPSPTVTETPIESPEPAPLPTEPETVADGLEAPWSVAWTEDGTALVSERDSGRILEIAADGATREVAVVADVLHGGEGGLLGLAVSGADLYVAFTAADGNRVVRYPLMGEPGALSLGSRTTVLDELPFARTHNGGRIAFGPDGMLYVPVGDAGNPDAAQDGSVRRGKILRVAPDGSVPADNPTPGSPVYSLGHRNVQGLAWDRDGTLYASEFGQDTWDELNVIEPGGNYGWPIVEGEGDDTRFVEPVATWPTDAASPSGIAVVDGAVLLANLRGEVLRAVSTDDPSQQADHWFGEYGRLRDVALAPDGSVWVLTNNTDGRGSPREGDDRILRVDPEVLLP